MSGRASEEAELDNVVWHALRGRQSRFAERHASGRALRFHPRVSIFCGVERLDEDGWAAQADFAGEGGVAFLFRDEVPALPPGWAEIYRDTVLQLVARALDAPPSVSFETLGDDDVEEMLALTALTEPGPFLPGTVELGGYVGARRDGRLVAMAGRRFSVAGFTEVSAVCTHPEARGEGLGAALTLQVAHAIRAQGDEAFLHVVESNRGALRLYRSIGFEVRRRVDVVGAQWVGESGADS